MKLKKFIKRLEKIRDKYGKDLEVVMTDYIPVIEPVFSSDKYLGERVVITDEDVMQQLPEEVLGASKLI